MGRGERRHLILSETSGRTTRRAFVQSAPRTLLLLAPLALGGKQAQKRRALAGRGDCIEFPDCTACASFASCTRPQRVAPWPLGPWMWTAKGICPQGTQTTQKESHCQSIALCWSQNRRSARTHSLQILRLKQSVRSEVVAALAKQH